MATTPLVSVVMPIYNDEEWLEASLKSCARQTTSEIEIICVDDASTDGTRAIIEAFQQQDDRVVLIAQEQNMSAFQARRAGILAARAPYVLFLDGDDELAPRAVEKALAKAKATGADVVGFGVEILTDDGRAMARFEKSLQPIHTELSGPEIMSGLFPVGTPAQGHLWRYLFETRVLRDAYASFAADLKIYRANDLPITFLAMAAATKYVSTPEKLYRYRFGRGTSGKKITTVDDFHFYLGAVDSIEGTASRVKQYAAADSGDRITDSYESARLSVIANILKYCALNAEPEVLGECLTALQHKVGTIDVARAAAWYFPDAQPILVRHLTEFPEPRREVRHVLLTTGNLRTGGVQTTLLAQASYLREAGFTVSVAIHDTRQLDYTLPPDIALIPVEGTNRAESLAAWARILRENDVDIVIDHHVLYNERWPLLVLVSRELGVPTIGWLHSFALRALADSRDRTSFLIENLPLLRDVVVLSPTDVAFWKLRGVEHTTYLPNPPSSLLQQLPERTVPRELGGGPVELAWWGRLQQSTKQVRELIRVASELRRLDVDFRLTIVGPDGDDLTAAQLREAADEAGVLDAIELPGELQGPDLVEKLATTHLFVSTSVVEGYQLTILEAQAMGMPVLMYELPWLLTVVANDGVKAVRQGDASALARDIAHLVADPQRYSALSAASLDFANQMHSSDFPKLYAQLLENTLSPSYSPAPSLDDARLLLEWTFFYAERNARGRNRLAANLRQTQKHLETERHRNRDLRTGWSFRLGRVLTYLPRKLRGN